MPVWRRSEHATERLGLTVARLLAARGDGATTAYASAGETAGGMRCELGGDHAVDGDWETLAAIFVVAQHEDHFRTFNSVGVESAGV